VAATLGVGIAVLGAAVVGVGPDRRAHGAPVAHAMPVVAEAPVARVGKHDMTTSASEQYRAWFMRRTGLASPTSASEQYRAWYTR
jgi:hypothetical protein